jgi:methyl-accepting chemotaxis protein
LTIRNRIAAITVIAAITAAAVGAVGIWQISEVAAQGTSIYKDGLIPDQEVGALRETVARARTDGLSRAYAKTPEAAAQYGKALEVDERQIDRLVESHIDRDLSSTERQALNQFVVAWHDYREARVLGDELAKQGRGAEWEKLRSERMTPDVNTALGALEDMSQASAHTARSKLDAAEQARSNGLTVSLAIILVSLLVIALVGVLTIRAMVGPLLRLRSVLESVAEGDLTRRVGQVSDDEVGDMSTALNTTLDTMHDVILQLEATAQQLSDQAEQASTQSTTASAAIELISNEVDAIHSEAENAAANLARIDTQWTSTDLLDSTHVHAVIDSMNANVKLLGRVVGDNDFIQATRTTASIMDDTRKTASSLAEMSASLTAMISVFKLNELPDAEGTTSGVSSTA